MCNTPKEHDILGNYYYMDEPVEQVLSMIVYATRLHFNMLNYVELWSPYLQTWQETATVWEHYWPRYSWPYLESN
jgi:hypothetical protein